MSNINDLLIDNIIDKEKLILKRGHLLNLDENQCRFLSKVFSNKESKFNNLTIVELAKIFSVNEKTAETILKDLVTNHLVDIGFLNDEMIFNFNNLIRKLLKTYDAPTNNDSNLIKEKWIINNLKFELSKENNIELKKIISKESWDKISLVITKMKETNDHSWPLFISLLNTVTLKSVKKDKDIKKLLDENWLA